MHTVKDIYELDEFFGWLYGNPNDPWGSYVPHGRERWNNTEIVLPNRTRRAREGSIEYGGITGAVAGHHFDLHIVDDMISQNQLQRKNKPIFKDFHMLTFFLLIHPRIKVNCMWVLFQEELDMVYFL